MKQLHPRDERRCLILEKYAKVDRENKVVTLPLHYESVNELISDKLSTKEKPVVYHNVFEDIEEAAVILPSGFTMNMDVTIDDYGDYTPEQIKEATIDSLELSYYHLNRVSSKSWLKAGFLYLLGVLLLILLIVLRAEGVIDGETSGAIDSIFDYVIDTFACVFIWEAISLLLLYPNEFSIKYRQIFRILGDIRLVDDKGKELASIEKVSLKQNWIDDTPHKRKGKVCLFISACIFLSVGMILLTDYLYGLFSSAFMSSSLSASAFISCTLTVVFTILAGVSAVCRFLERGVLAKCTGIFAIILTLSNIYLLAMVVALRVNDVPVSAASYFAIVGNIIAVVIYFTGFLLTRKKKIKKPSQT